MNPLLTSIMLWLSANFGFPVTYSHPKIAIVPPIEIVYARYGALTADAKQRASAAHRANVASKMREVVSVYDDANATILLPDGWTGSTPAELSVLVHEMVHHLQKSAGLKYGCPAERERPAYEAQEKWLGLFGQSLESEFQIDAMTLLVSTRCGL
jgi:hypothetical protein